jgi:hypothetical protein
MINSLNGILRSALLTFGLAAVLCGCASTATAPVTSKVITRVTVFHTNPEIRGQSFIFHPLEDQKTSLEYKQYSEVITGHLQQAGMALGRGESDYVLEFTYGISGSKEVSESTPIIGRTGSSSSTIIGNTVHHNPTYGIVGSQSYSSTEYVRAVTLRIFKTNSGIREQIPVYEAKLTSAGSSSHVAAVFPAMMKALFAEFPGKSGHSAIRTMSRD